jgi:hypothetical protein
MYMQVQKDAIRLDPIVRDNEKYPGRKPECRHNSLKQVKIVGFCSSKSLVALTVHILESAPSLERLTLDMAYGYDTWSRCCASREVSQCLPMSNTALTEDHKAIEVASRYIAGKVPTGVEFHVLEPCSRCHSGHP